TRPSQSISPFAPPAFTGFHAPTKKSDFCMDVGRSSLPPSGLPLRTPSLTRGGVPFADPCRPPRVRTLDVLPLPAPIPLRSRLDFGRRVPWHAHPIGPACTGLHLRSVLQRASGFFPTRPHGARPDCLATPRPACSCLRLAVASNLLRRGLAPPIQGPCLAHQGRAFGGAEEAPSLTAAARDDDGNMRSGRKNARSAGRTKEWNDKEDKWGDTPIHVATRCSNELPRVS